MYTAPAISPFEIDAPSYGGCPVERPLTEAERSSPWEIEGVEWRDWSVARQICRREGRPGSEASAELFAAILAGEA